MELLSQRIANLREEFAGHVVARVPGRAEWTQFGNEPKRWRICGYVQDSDGDSFWLDNFRTACRKAGLCAAELAGETVEDAKLLDYWLNQLPSTADGPAESSDKDGKLEGSVYYGQVPRLAEASAQQLAKMQEAAWRQGEATEAELDAVRVARNAESAYRSASNYPQQSLEIEARKQIEIERIKLEIKNASPQATSESPEIDNVAKALGLLVLEPNLTIDEVALRVGVNRTTIYKPSWKKYRDARELMKAPSVPKGSKSSDGTIEAVDDEY